MSCFFPCVAPAQTPGIAFTPGASQAAPAQHYDLNVNTLPAAQGGIYDLNPSATQTGPAGTITMTSKAPPLAYSFDEMIRNSHGYVSAGVATHNGHMFAGGVEVPVVPGVADLGLDVSTGQLGTFHTYPGGPKTTVTYDAYSASLSLHPSDDFSAFIGITGLHVKSSNGYAPYWPY